MFLLTTLAITMAISGALYTITGTGFVVASVRLDDKGLLEALATFLVGTGVLLPAGWLFLLLAFHFSFLLYYGC